MTEIKLIVFDLDGVLLTSRDMHYHALNRALEEVCNFSIARDEHISTFDGLPTTKKLGLLTEQGRVPENVHHTIWRKKQKHTRDVIAELPVDKEKVKLFEVLRDKGYKIAVASNSIRENTRLMLHYVGLLHLTDWYYTNQDVVNPKPSPEMYLRCMLEANVGPKETVIVEDSHVGRKAALASGAHLCAVRNPDEVTLARVLDYIDRVGGKLQIRPKWQGGDMNILIPMAGAGRRFAEVGYTFPKPLIEVHGKPMIQLVVENLNIDARHVFVVQKDHYETYNMKHLLNLIAPNCEIVLTEGVTEGAACTTLLAKEHINTDEPLLMANCDQFIEWDSNEFMYSMQGDSIDGGIATFTGTHPKWSFVRLDDDGFVCEVAEKKPISDQATVGLYYWTKGSDYVKYAEQMIEKNIRVNNEFYVAPVYNEALLDGLRIKPYPVDAMHSMGTPEDLREFLDKTRYLKGK